MVAVYYRVYIRGQAIQSNMAVYQEDRTLGRIPATSVAPPQTVDALKRCVTRAEGIINFTNCDLFLDLTCDAPVNEGPLSIIAKDCPGSTPERAMAFVYSLPESPPSQEIVPTIATPKPASRTRFNQKIIAIQDCGMWFHTHFFENIT
jgi:hypothetical protein